MLCNVVDRAAGDGRKNTVGSGNDQCIVLIHQKDIGAAGLLQFGPGRGIQINILRKAFLMGIYDRMQAHRIVEARLDVAGSSGSRAVKVTDTDYDRLCAALEVRADRCRENAEHIVICRLNADDGADSEHIGTDIESSTRAVRRHPCLIRPDGGLDGLHKSVNRERRHLKTKCRVVHSLCVEIGAETYDVSVFRLIGFESLEN